MNKGKPSVGIDLGTTYSCVAVFKDGRPEVIANSQGNRITPSVVAFKNKERLIGEAAEIQRKLDPQNAIYNAKKFIGRKWDDPSVQEKKSSYPFRVEEQDNKVNFRVLDEGDNIKLTPEEVSAAVLLRMKTIAEEYLEEKVDDVVITVPAYFNDSQRQATKDAGQIAGLNVIRIINEPTAAAMAYGLREGTEKFNGMHVLVYDLGGGTFDASILEVEDDFIQVKSTCGNTDLGGEDFNTLLVKHFKKEIFRAHAVDLTTDHKAVRRLTNACETLKRNLSADNNTSSKMELESLLPDGKDYKLMITRLKFESLCKDLFDETLKDVKKALEDAKLNKEQIDEIVIVGGSSRIPKIRTMLSNFFEGKALNKSINPDEAVACGAAIQAAILNDDQDASIKDFLLLDVNALSLGVDNAGETTTIIIERNTPIPVKKQVIRLTAGDNQTDAVFSIIEGERTMVKDNCILGNFRMSGIPPMPAGKESFDLVFELDANCILTVTATLVSTGQSKGITIDAKTTGRMSTEDINSLIEKAEEMKVMDEAEENRATAKNRLLALCSHIKLDAQKKSKKECSDIISISNDCIKWIEDHSDAKEEQIISKYKSVAKYFLNVDRSSHVSRMNKMTSTYCLDQAKACLKSGLPDSLNQATEFFQKAYNIAKAKGRRENMAEAGQSIGHVYRMKYKDSLSVEEKIQICVSAAWRLACTMDNGKFLKKENQKELFSDMTFFSHVFFDITSTNPNILQDRSMKRFMMAISNAVRIDNLEWRKIALNCYKKEVLLYQNEIHRHLEVDDFKKVLWNLNEVNFSKDQARSLAIGTREESQVSDMLKILESYEKQSNGLSHIEQAEDILEGVKENNPDAIDRALTALDHLTAAIYQTQGSHPRIYIKAKLFEGTIFLDLIMNKMKAKSCFEEIINNGKENRLDEYKEAKFNLEKLEVEEKEKKKESVSREVHLKALEKELGELDAADRTMSDDKFVTFLLKTFPPKHKGKYDQLTITGNNTKKRVYIRLSTYYHPDKVNATVYGEKYKVLCEEISKRVNAKFIKM